VSLRSGWLKPTPGFATFLDVIMWEIRNAYNILVRKTEGTIPLKDTGMAR
jgi:hypothetical protein